MPYKLVLVAPDATVIDSWEVKTESWTDKEPDAYDITKPAARIEIMEEAAQGIERYERTRKGRE